MKVELTAMSILMVTAFACTDDPVPPDCMKFHGTGLTATDNTLFQFDILANNCVARRCHPSSDFADRAGIPLDFNQRLDSTTRISSSVRSYIR